MNETPAHIIEISEKILFAVMSARHEREFGLRQLSQDELMELAEKVRLLAEFTVREILAVLGPAIVRCVGEELVQRNVADACEVLEAICKRVFGDQVSVTKIPDREKMC